MISQKLISIKDGYLKHRSPVDNISNVFSIIKESFQGTYIGLDFSENISIKPKFEVQEAHFYGKQFTLHCSIFEPDDDDDDDDDDDEFFLWYG